MGTRSTTLVIDDNYELVRIYRQFDGYPEGHGVDLAKLLKGFKIGNGRQDKPRYANGMRELGAILVMKLKRAEPHGNIYLEPPGGEVGDWIEYVYIVRQQGDGVVIECSTHASGAWPFNMQAESGFVFAGYPEDWLRQYAPKKQKVSA